MLKLRYDTPPTWAEAVLSTLNAFLQDHAANERKVSQAALTLAVHHPERSELVSAMIEVAQEEFDHFRQVYALLVSRGSRLAQDAPDPYMSGMMRSIKKADIAEYLLNRLVVFAIVEARGCERFRLVSEALEPGPLKVFYADLTRSEARHHALFLRLARLYFDPALVEQRLDELLEVEAEVVRSLPIRSVLH